MSDYFPSLKQIRGMFVDPRRHLMRNVQQIVEGKIARSDKIDVDKAVSDLDQYIEKLPIGKKRTNVENLRSRLVSVSDLTSKLYNEFAQNPNSLHNWFPAIEAAVMNQSFFKVPKTISKRMPIEIAQFIRLEYQDTTQVSKERLNNMLFDLFELEDDKEYFIKTGTFSSKFEFHNAHLKEPREIGEYFQVINNFAMEVGAGHSVDLVVREYIEDKDNRPTIYNGMPLRTEFRAFVDFDSDTLEGIVPYWHPVVMKGALKRGLSAEMEKDYATYRSIEDTLSEDYNEHVQAVKQNLEEIIPNINLTGRYSVDIMKNGEDFYIIDLATTETSALYELLPQNNGTVVTFEDVYPNFD